MGRKSTSKANSKSEKDSSPEKLRDRFKSLFGKTNASNAKPNGSSRRSGSTPPRSHSRQPEEDRGRVRGRHDSERARESDSGSGTGYAQGHGAVSKPSGPPSFFAQGHTPLHPYLQSEPVHSSHTNAGRPLPRAASPRPPPSIYSQAPPPRQRNNSQPSFKDRPEYGYVHDRRGNPQRPPPQPTRRPKRSAFYTRPRTQPAGGYQPVEPSPSRWQAFNPAEGFVTDGERDPSIPLIVGQPRQRWKLFGGDDQDWRINNKVLAPIPWHEHEYAADMPLDNVCLEPTDPDGGYCGAAVPAQALCKWYGHDARVCNGCSLSSAQELLAPTGRQVTAREMQQMRAYLCGSCTRIISKDATRVRQVQRAGIYNVFGGTDSHGNTPASIRGGSDGDINFDPTLLPITGCRCGLKIFLRRQCRYHRFLAAEVAIKQAALMREWRLNAYGFSACPVCVATKAGNQVGTSIDAFCPQDNGLLRGSKAWACLVCGDWAVQKQDGPRLIPGWEDIFDEHAA